jgi:hypothetical protein
LYLAIESRARCLGSFWSRKSNNEEDLTLTGNSLAFFDEAAPEIKEGIR